MKKRKKGSLAAGKLRALCLSPLNVISLDYYKHMPCMWNVPCGVCIVLTFVNNTCLNKELDEVCISRRKLHSTCLTQSSRQTDPDLSLLSSRSPLLSRL